jgi:hypothetical protein
MPISLNLEMFTRLPLAFLFLDYTCEVLPDYTASQYFLVADIRNSDLTF